MLHYICIQELSSFFFHVISYYLIKCSCHCWWKQLKWSILYRARISDITNVFLHTFYSTWTLNSSNLDTKTKVWFWGISLYIFFVLLLYFVNGYNGLQRLEKNNMTLASKVVYLISDRFNSLLHYCFVVLL